MNFSAVILAGGRSSRMGRDKAFLDLDGQPLLARQIGLAREIGAQEVFISGRPEADYTRFGLRVLSDRTPGAGPLAGIESALRAATTPLLLTLAVDMPHMNAAMLRRLAAHCTERTGAIPRVAGHLEPLAAFYPATAQLQATQMLNAALTLNAKAFAERCVIAGLASFVDLPAADSRCFTNWNSPTDVASVGSSECDSSHH